MTQLPVESRNPDANALSGPVSSGMSRRRFLWSGISALTVPMVGGCFGSSSDATGPTFPDSVSHLTARPGIPTEKPTLGLSELGLGGERDGVMFVPHSYNPRTPLPLFIGLHGARGDADNWQSYPDRAEERRMVFLAPDSRDLTWDLMTHPNRTFGPDVEFLNEMLLYAFARCRIDPARIVLGGFSDGASYAISLGIGNGDLFSHVVAYSPGYFVAPDPIIGKPRVFVSHAPWDTVLRFRTTRDIIVPSLNGAGYDVTFHEFEGGHEVPAAVSDTALDWIFT